MSLQLNGTDGVTFNDGSEQWAAASPIGTKNLIINGNMQIAQRGTSYAGVTTSGYYTVDRWNLTFIGAAGTWTQTQDSDVPSGQGFSHSLKMSCTTAKTTLDANSLLQFQQKFEGQMIQHLCYGTSNAKTVTISFWVKSNKTGVFAYRLFQLTPSRQINKSFTINSADTWEKKTITIEGDVSGNIANDNTGELFATIYFVAGTDYTSGTDMTTWSSYVSADSAVTQTVNLADSTSNYINITGVQLEVGDTATPFEHRPYDMELARCQRYCVVYGGDSNFDTPLVGCSYSTTIGLCQAFFPVELRATPSLSVSSASDWHMHVPGLLSQACTSLTITTQNGKKTQGVNCYSSNANFGGYKAANVRAGNTTSARMIFSAEL